ncbi:DUF2187 domain-containing protein [Bacillus thuringiensis serovar navarrensis]|uniref:DUF2187 domain-containing protein n=1 Tax=Bacillus thuringiensis serovar navarrensis TaxID=339658 RepID=A0A243AGX4_BACTU|nr:DUF2187 family protein [Bacillus thuringiensis]OTY20742.1 DUF2187 domain-containing protein [Bacillus thuringiensis serovar navarrensis]
MEHNKKAAIGDYVQFSYRKNPTLQLTGFVVSVLQNTIVVDVSQIMKIEVDDVRQVVKHSYYKKVVHTQIKNNVHNSYTAALTNFSFVRNSITTCSNFLTRFI